MEQQSLDWAAGYEQGYADALALVASQKGMRLSRKPTDTQRNAVNLTLPRSGTKGSLLWSLFCEHGDHGLTDDEVERLTGWTHQSASAMRNGLMTRGLLKDSGQRRKNRRGLDCIVWVRVSPPRLDADDSKPDPVPVAALSESDLGNCLECGSAPGFHSHLCTRKGF